MPLSSVQTKVLALLPSSLEAIAACKFDFGSVYGEVAKGLIHVHHIIPLSSIGSEYELNPITDLIPLCPNCHAVVHRGAEVMSIEKLKECLATARATSLETDDQRLT
ncbi:HNH endonuclease [Pseudomonas putida]|uniref:HNH endonuclease n=1 Tax=Pseudomonas putida TaxID=303 RepID=UPI001F07B8D2|nr:HNH endonuclease [Pseudomonas putida]